MKKRRRISQNHLYLLLENKETGGKILDQSTLVRV